DQADCDRKLAEAMVVLELVLAPPLGGVGERLAGGARPGHVGRSERLALDCVREPRERPDELDVEPAELRDDRLVAKVMDDRAEAPPLRVVGEDLAERKVADRRRIDGRAGPDLGPPVAVAVDPVQGTAPRGAEEASEPGLAVEPEHVS